MQLDDLRALARIADLLSVSAAARTLSLPKSSVSLSLARLERDVGSALVDRSTRHLRLTDAGVALRPHALRIDMPVEPVDLAIRVGALPDGDLVARRLL